MATLFLSLKSEYFDAIRAGTKTEEYRLINEYWIKRLIGREYDKVVFTKGYPRKDDMTRRMEFQYDGYVFHTIQHPHFGSSPVNVFAIQFS